MTLVFQIQSVGVRRLLIFLTIVCSAGAQGSRIEHGLTLVDELHHFLVGFLLCDLYVTDWKMAPRGQRIWDVAATLALAAIPVVLLYGVFHHVIVSGLIFVFFAGTFRGHVWNRIVCSPLLYTIGGMCYTIYLYHSLFKAAFGRFSVQLSIGDSYAVNLLLQQCLLIPIIISFCSLLFLTFEKPFMRRDWTNRVGEWLRHIVGAVAVTVTGGNRR